MEVEKVVRPGTPEQHAAVACGLLSPFPSAYRVSKGGIARFRVIWFREDAFTGTQRERTSK